MPTPYSYMILIVVAGIDVWIELDMSYDVGSRAIGTRAVVFSLSPLVA